mgnify:CR=1 FL=1
MHMAKVTREILEKLYRRFNRPEFIHPDPLEVVLEYPDIRDREIAGLIAAGLAYGRVAQIIKSVRRALTPLGNSPRDFLDSASEGELRNLYPDFVHRFTTGEQLGLALSGIKRCLEEFGSLNRCFAAGLSKKDETVIPALAKFTGRLAADFPGGCCYLLSSPEKGSACKRMNLYLKWMIRKDAVDPGGWSGVSPAKLVVPVDRHMHRIGSAIGLTTRKSADLKTALEMTKAFREFSPDDPVKYDFAITRLGIRPEQDPAEFIAACAGKPI